VWDWRGASSVWRRFTLLPCYCINATSCIRVESLVPSPREGIGLVRTCAIRCPAKRLFVFLIFMFARLFLVKRLDSIRSCLRILGLDGSISLLVQSFSQPVHIDAEAVICRRHAC